MESLPADAVAKLIADIFAAVSRMLNDILMAFLIAFAAPGPPVGDDSDTEEAEDETQRTDPEKSVNMGKILLKMQHGVCEEHYSPGEDKGEENISPVSLLSQGPTQIIFPRRRLYQCHPRHRRRGGKESLCQYGDLG